MSEIVANEDLFFETVKKLFLIAVLGAVIVFVGHFYLFDKELSGDTVRGKSSVVSVEECKSAECILADISGASAGIPEEPQIIGQYRLIGIGVLLSILYPAVEIFFFVKDRLEEKEKKEMKKEENRAVIRFYMDTKMDKNSNEKNVEKGSFNGEFLIALLSGVAVFFLLWFFFFNIVSKVFPVKESFYVLSTGKLPYF